MSAPHVMILASAGSGKTYALTDRFVELLAAGAAPERIVALTQQEPPFEATHWTGAMMAKAVGVSVSSVQRMAVVDTAKLTLLQARQKATSTIKSYESDVTAKLNTLELQRERLADMKKQLELTKIFAPQDGLVVYATGSASGSGILIEQGASIRQKQDLLKLPDVTQMMIEVKVHESHVRQVKPGLGAYVTIDSLPDKQFTGVVRKVAVLPDTTSRYYNPNMKVYSTEVWINVGNPGFAFQRLQGVFLEVGCAAPYSVAIADQSLVWLGQKEYADFREVAAIAGVYLDRDAPSEYRGVMVRPSAMESGIRVE